MTSPAPPCSDPWSTQRLLAVGGGAATGALLRAWVAHALPSPVGHLPAATLVVNLTGCLVIGLVTPVVNRLHPLVGLTLTTGVLGGYTTFSTFCLDLLHLSGRSATATTLYLGVTVVGCVLAATTGLLAGERILTGTRPGPAPGGTSQDDDGHPGPVVERRPR